MIYIFHRKVYFAQHWPVNDEKRGCVEISTLAFLREQLLVEVFGGMVRVADEVTWESYHDGQNPDQRDLAHCAQPGCTLDLMT